MPIFTSRFSPDRSLVGKFIASRTRENEDAESRDKNRRSENAQSRASQKATTDRLDISNKQQTSFATQVRETEQPVETRATNPVAVPQDARQNALRKASQEAVVARSNLRSSLEESARGASVAKNTPSASNTQQTSFSSENFNALQNALTKRLDVLVERLSTARTEQSVQANVQANQAAVKSADPAPLAALTEAVAEPEPEPSVPVTKDVVPTPEVQLENRIEQLREKRLEFISKFEPPEPPAREEQQAALRNDLKTISTGLQTDAAIESKRTLEETERNSNVVAQRQQRQAIRENQTEINNLQTSKRQLDQEAQKTDQAIRQLQSETARIKNNAPSSGTALNILAQ